MYGRRSHPRFSITTQPDGTLRILRDVLVRRIDDHQLIAISREAGIIGEILTIQLPEESSGSRSVSQVRVVESRPMLLDGGLRHRLRLEEVTGT